MATAHDTSARSPLRHQSNPHDTETPSPGPIALHSVAGDEATKLPELGAGSSAADRETASAVHVPADANLEPTGPTAQDAHVGGPNAADMGNGKRSVSRDPILDAARQGGNLSAAESLASCDENNLEAGASPEPAERPTKRSRVSFAEEELVTVFETYAQTEYDRSMAEDNSYVCDGCGYFITSDRHHCTRCNDYDLCADCFARHVPSEASCAHEKPLFVTIPLDTWD